MELGGARTPDPLNAIQVLSYLKPVLPVTFSGCKIARRETPGLFKELALDYMHRHDFKQRWHGLSRPGLSSRDRHMFEISATLYTKITKAWVLLPPTSAVVRPPPNESLLQFLFRFPLPASNPDC